MKFNDNDVEKLQRKLNIENSGISNISITSEKDRVNQRINMYHKNNEKLNNKLNKETDVQKHSYYSRINKNNQ